MAQLLYLAAAALCPITMAILMWIMMRSSAGPSTPPEPSGEQHAELERLRHEVESRARRKREPNHDHEGRPGEVRPGREMAG